MFQRRRCDSGVVYYHSSLLSAARIPHAFSTRIGGVSSPPFDSLNFGSPAGAVQDSVDHIDANYVRLLSAMGEAQRKVLRVHQVHGGIVVREPSDICTRADAVVVSDPAFLASVRIADCVPVLLATEDGAVAAAVHAGWRGVVAGVVHHALAELRAIHPGVAILAAIGPCISFDAFEVGPEVLEAFVSLLGAEAPIRREINGKGRVNLRASITLQLAREGVARGQIDVSEKCTVGDRDEFFSHRRDNGVTGRMVALIGARKKD